VAQKTSWDGAVLSEADINTYLMGEGGAWTSWTPTATQSGSVPVTVTAAGYARHGRLIHFRAVLAVTGSGTGANTVVFSLPVACAGGHNLNSPLGQGLIIDSSASLWYPGILVRGSTTSNAYIVADTTAVNSYLGAAGFTAGLASGDTIFLQGWYEAAS